MASAREFRVEPGADAGGDGSKERPCGSLKEARQQLGGHFAGAVVRLEKGIHYLDETIHLDSRDGGTEEAPTRFVGEEGAFLSGGRRVLNWSRVRQEGPDLWLCQLPEVAAGDWYFRQLQLPGQPGKLRRSRFPDEGWLRGLEGSHVDFPITRNETRDEANGWRRTKLDLFTTLRLKEEDRAPFAEAAEWADLQSGEMLLLQSWDASWHSLRSIDAETGDMKFFTPSRYPMNHWHYSINQLGAPFALENLQAGIDAPGEWSLDRKTGQLFLQGWAGFDPNKTPPIAPRMERLVEIKGTEAEPVRWIRFEGVGFRDNQYPLGYYDQHQDDWPEIMRKLDPDFPKEFPEGCTDSQAAPRAGAAVRLEHASDVIFERCRFVDLGNWGARLSRDVHRAAFSRCHFARLGAGAVMIDSGSGGLPLKQVASHNVVADCLIEKLGLVHPATVAIRIAEARENEILHNEIREIPYSAISVGWHWSRTPNQCFGNVIEGNDIHHITNLISDGAGFYSLGLLGGTVCRENHIHDVLRSEFAVGAGNTGMLLDQYSLGILLERNVIRRVQSFLPADKRKNEVKRQYRNEEGEHVWIDNDFAEGDEPVRLGEVVDKAGPRP